MIIVLDANLLLLLIVGMAGRDYISIHRRLRAYTAADFILLTQLLAAAPKIIVTPNTLTETSNLAGQIGEPARSRIYQMFRALVAGDGVEEVYSASKLAVARTEFERLGLTDSCLLNVTTATYLLLTVDLDLYLAAQRRGLKALQLPPRIVMRACLRQSNFAARARQDTQPAS